MGNLSILEQIINNKIMDLHTSYLAKVLTVNGNRADIQPLMATKNYNGELESYAIISNVPISRTANEYVENGSIVVCVVCERNITEALKGKISLTNNGIPYSLSDSVIVGVI